MNNSQIVFPPKEPARDDTGEGGAVVLKANGKLFIVSKRDPERQGSGSAPSSSSRNEVARSVRWPIFA
jgi:hypothetical protein